MYLFRFIESMTKKEEPESAEGTSQPAVEPKNKGNNQSSYHKEKSSSGSGSRQNFQDRSFKKPDYEKGNRQAFEQKKPFQSGNKKSFDKPAQETKSKQNKTDSAYVLFSANGESFLGIYKNDKRTFKLDGIEHPEKTGYYSNIARNFINQQIKKKVVFLTIKGEDTEGRLIVDAFLDEEKTQCLNTMMIDEQLHQVKKKSYPKKNTDSLKYPKSKLSDTNTNTNVPQEDVLSKTITPQPLTGYQDYSSKNFQHLGNIGNIATLAKSSDKNSTLENQVTDQPQDISNEHSELEPVFADNEPHWEGSPDSYEHAPAFDEPPAYYDDSYEPVSEEEFFATQEHEPVKHVQQNQNPVQEQEQQPLSLPETTPILHEPEIDNSYQEPYEQEAWHDEGNYYYDENEHIPVSSDNHTHIHTNSKAEEYDLNQESHEKDNGHNDNYNDDEYAHVNVNSSEDSFFDELMSVEGSLPSKIEPFQSKSDSHQEAESVNIQASEPVIVIEPEELPANDMESKQDTLMTLTDSTYHIDNDPFMKELMSVFDDIPVDTPSQSIQKSKPKFR